MAQYLDLEKAVDYLIDETSEGAPFRDGKEFVRGHFLEKKVDPPQPPHVRGSEVIRIGINGAGEATIWFRPENRADRDREVRADLYRLSEWQPCGLEDLRRRFALPLIVRACAEGRWKADGKEPGSAKREDILARDFIGSEIDQYTGDLMSTPGPTSSRPESTVPIWTELMFSVPGGADEGKAAELPEPTDPAPSAVRPNRRGRKPGQAPFAKSDKLLIKEMHKLVGDDEEEASVLWAAKQFAGQAKGAGTLESKVDRLRKRYREEHPLKEL